jgi:hypothetical protein
MAQTGPSPDCFVAERVHAESSTRGKHKAIVVTEREPSLDEIFPLPVMNFHGRPGDRQSDSESASGRGDAMGWIDLLCYSASVSVFGMKKMLALRLLAIISNILFALYGFYGQLYPVLLLHLALLPVNVFSVRTALLGRARWTRESLRAFPAQKLPRDAHRGGPRQATNERNRRYIFDAAD